MRALYVCLPQAGLAPTAGRAGGGDKGASSPSPAGDDGALGPGAGGLRRNRSGSGEALLAGRGGARAPHTGGGAGGGSGGGDSEDEEIAELGPLIAKRNV